MSDSFSETTTKSWFERLKDSMKSILLGVVLFIVAFPLLWWNEGRAVQTAKSLAEGSAAVVSVQIDSIDSTNENKLVHATGMATTDETLSDGEFGISENAIKLIRHVEMFQWQEDEHKETERQTGGSEKTTTTYSHETKWFDHLIDSSEFKKPDGHRNPANMPFASRTTTATKVTLGDFKLSGSQISRLTATEPLTMNSQLLQQVPEAVRSQLQIRGGAFYRPASVPAASVPANSAPAADVQDEATSTDGSESGDGGEDGESGAEGQPGSDEPAEPKPAESAPPLSESSGPAEVGDVRISFSVVKPMTISLIAQQAGDTFRPYQTKAGDALDMLKPGSESAESMFKAAVAGNNRLTWILRLVGLALMMIGVSMVFSPLAVMADVLPILGNLARGGIFFVALAISLPLSLMTIAVAWLAYRPMLGVGLIVAAVAAGVGIYMIFLKKRPAK